MFAPFGSGGAPLSQPFVRARRCFFFLIGRRRRDRIFTCGPCHVITAPSSVMIFISGGFHLLSFTSRTTARNGPLGHSHSTRSPFFGHSGGSTPVRVVLRAPPRGPLRAGGALASVSAMTHLSDTLHPPLVIRPDAAALTDLPELHVAHVRVASAELAALPNVLTRVAPPRRHVALTILRGAEG